MTTGELFDRITLAAPSFEAVRRAHLKSYDQVLPHVLIGELREFVESRFSGTPWEGAAPPNADEIQKVFEVLDTGLEQGDGSTFEVIAASFVEGIDENPYFEHLKLLFGPKLSKLLIEQNNWRLPD